MEYEFEPGLIDEPKQYDVSGLTPPATLSTGDKQWVLQIVSTFAMPRCRYFSRSSLPLSN